MTRERHGHLHRHRRTAPKLAVALSAVLNLVGAFPSVEVALTVTNAVINIQTSKGGPRPELLTDGGSALLLIVLAGLVGGIVWNLLTWLLGLPSSSSHALFGVLIGAAIAGLGVRGVKWVGDGSKLDGGLGKVVLPAAMSPLICRPRRRNRHPADLQGGRRRRYPLHGPGLPSWPDRQRVAGLAGPRHERRPEDDERHYPCSPRRRRVDRHRLNPVVGQGHRCASYRPRHVCRGLADHPHARQGTGRDLAATGDGRRERFGCRDPQFQPLGFRPLHDARRD
jgi:Phosphate transporter family